MLKHFFAAAAEYLTLVVNYEANRIESPEEFQRCRMVPIFKDKPGNDKANPLH